MPQKRNPWNSEHVKSLWKTFSPRIYTFFSDQISEHQRDLTNSASSRFIGEYLAGFTAAVCRIKKVLQTLQVDRSSLERNLVKGGDAVLAEAAYILLAESGEPNAHEIIRLCTLEREEKRTTLREVLHSKDTLWNNLKSQIEKTLGIDPKSFFPAPNCIGGKL
jgi:adenylosuccinate lyase